MKPVHFVFTAALAAGCIAPQAVFAADPAALEAQIAELRAVVQDLRLTVENQQREIALLKGQTPPPFTTPPSAAPKPKGRWNPEIGVIADTVFTADSPREDTEGADRVSVRELEIVFGSAVDPYSRLDATVSFSDFEEAGIEEAYYTHFGLPLDSTARVGRFKPYVGKAIAVHRDSLDTVDEPLVIHRYFGAEGYSKSGIDVKIPVALPTPLAHEAAFGVLEGGSGEGGTLFGAARRHPTLYTHLKNYLEIDEASGLELGASFLAGSKDDDSTFETNVFGFDGTWIRHLGDRRHVKLQSESFLVNREESFVQLEDPVTGVVTLEDIDDNRHLWGSYVLADWRFDPRWAGGFRWDRVQRIDAPTGSQESADAGYTGYLTFHQSEFARWRVQFSHFDLTDGNDDDRVLVQGTFAIGEHKHKLT